MESMDIVWTSMDNPQYPLHLEWGDAKKMHSLVCQGGNSIACHIVPKANGREMMFELGEPIGNEDREKNREVAFYLDLSDEHDISIEGAKATTFHLGEEVWIQSRGRKLMLRFHLEEGEGVFMGHVMKGNRPSQPSLKGNDRFQANDWQIFMRTVQRSHPCRLRVDVTDVTG